MVFAQNKTAAFVTTHSVAKKTILNDEQKNRYHYIRKHNFVIRNNASTHKPEIVINDAK